MRTPHFLECEPGASGGPDAPYAVLPAPYERTVSYGRGTGGAPAAILGASAQIEWFDEELLTAPCLRVQTLPAVDCREGDDEAVLERIARAAEPEMRRGRFVLALGGEHTISAPLVRAAAAATGPLSVLHVDSHLDLRDRFRGAFWSHACVMRRILDAGVPVVSVGIRSLCEEEYTLVRERRLAVCFAAEIAAATNEAWIEAVLARLAQRVYVTIDADGLDPSVMPGTGTPEPGGLTWRQITRLLRRVCAVKTVVAADLVEVAPIPGSVVSEYTAARLATKLLTYHALRPPA